MNPHNEQGRVIVLILAIVSAIALVGCQTYQRPDGTTGSMLDPQKVHAAQAAAGTVGGAVAGAAQTIGAVTGNGTIFDIGVTLTQLLTVLGIGGAGVAAHSLGRHRGWDEKAKSDTASS